MSEFQASYSIDDGYAGNRRHNFKLSSNEFDEFTTDEELKEIFNEIMQEHFEQNVYPIANNLDEYLDWAKKQIEEMKK